MFFTRHVLTNDEPATNTVPSGMVTSLRNCSLKMQPPGPEPVGVSVGGMGVGGDLVGDTVGAMGGMVGGACVETWAASSVGVVCGAGVLEANVQASETANHITKAAAIR